MAKTHNTKKTTEWQPSEENRRQGRQIQAEMRGYKAFSGCWTGHTKTPQGELKKGLEWP